MHRLFTQQASRGKIISPRFMQARNKYILSYNKVSDHYRTYNTYLNNKHILVRLLIGLDIDPETSDQDLYRRTEHTVDRTAAGLGITTDLNNGELHEEAFYVDECAIVAVEFGEFYDIPSWTEIRAVRPLTHPHTTLKFVLPHLMTSMDDGDYAVVGIDIPMLAIQYRHWLKQNILKPAGEQENVTQFITRYVLPGMLPEQADIALRNRMLHAANMSYRTDDRLDTPIFVNTFDKEFDEAIEDLTIEMMGGSKAFSEVMENIPMIFHDNYFDAVPRELDSLSIFSYWVSLMVYVDWTYSAMVAVPSIDSGQELVDKKMKKIKRYVKGTRATKFMKGAVLKRFMVRYEEILARFL